MADRPNQFNGYPMIPNNFSMNLLQQQQQQQQMQQLVQQQQQNALNQARGIPGMSNSENQQMWQQLQLQHRSQMGGMDSMGNQGMAQMAGMNRNPFMNQMQGQSMQQNVNAQPGQVRQFSNLGVMNNIRQQQQQQQMAQRSNPPQQNFASAQLLNNPAMVQQPLQTSQNFSRQLALLNHASQQLPQNGPLNPTAFSQQNSQMNGHMGVDQGGSADGQSTQRMAPTLNMSEEDLFMMDKEGQRRLTQDEVSYRLALFNRELESLQHKLESSRNNPAEAHTLPNLAARIAAKHMFLQRLNQRVASEFPLLAMGGQPSTPMHMQNMHTPGQQPAPAQRGPTPQQGWSTPLMNGAHPAQQNGSLFTPGQTPHANSQMQFDALARAQANANANANAMSRNVHTPVTQPGGHASFMNRPITSSPRPSNGQPVGPGAVQATMQQILSSRNIHPIERDKFNESLPQYLDRTRKKVNEQLLAMPSGQKVDLHTLHTLVINHGGGPAVKSNDLWPIIAAKLGFPLAPPGQHPEPRADAKVGERVREIYDEYLQDFEKHYTMMVLDKLVRTNPLQQPTFNTPQGHTQGPPTAGGSPSGGPSVQQPRVDPRQLILQLVQGNVSVEVMRSKGVPDSLIEQVEILRRRVSSGNQGVPANMLQGPRQTGGPAPLSHPPGSENFSGNNQMTSMQNGPPHRQMPGMLPVVQNQMMQGQVPLSAQRQLQHQILAKTTPERLQAAGLLVKRMREQATEDRNKKQLQIKHIPDSEKAQFVQHFELLFKLASEANNFLPTFYAVVGDETGTRTMVQVYDMAMRQRQLLSSPSPEYMLDLNMVKRLLQMVMAFKHQLNGVFQQADKPTQLVQQTGSYPPPSQGPPSSAMGPTSQGVNSILPAQQPVPQPNHPMITPAVPANAMPSNAQQNRQTPQMQPMTIPSKPKPQGQMSNPSGGPSTQVAPSPAASAVTPSQSASAASPTNYASPQTPKSPKGRATAKKPSAAKQSGRRQSKANANANANAPSTPTAEQAGTPASSAPTPATVASTPDNKENSTLKRQREPESSSSGQASSDQPSSASDEGPIVKRLKGEWESTPDTNTPKHEEEAADIKTTEQAADFFTQMTELMQIVSGTEGQSMPSEVSDALSQVLKSAGSFQGLADSSLGDELLASGSKSPKHAPQDEFTEYFDYSYFKDEETPDLTAHSSTSTGASPDSNAAENGGHIPPPDSSKSTDSKLATHSSDLFDPSHLGFLGEIDGGEAEYFTSRDGWRWGEPPSSTQDTQWAIST